MLLSLCIITIFGIELLYCANWENIFIILNIFSQEIQYAVLSNKCHVAVSYEAPEMKCKICNELGINIFLVEITL